MRTTGWPAFSSAASLAVVRPRRSPSSASVDEEAVVAVDLRPPSGSPSIGIRPLPCLPVDSANSCSGQAPKLASPGDAMMRDLVAARQSGGAEREAEHDAGIFRRRHVRAAGAHHHPCRPSPVRDIDPGDRRRNQAELRQHRIAAADARLAVEDVAEALRLRGFFQCEPGSVMAMKWPPALSAPTVSATRLKK